MYSEHRRHPRLAMVHKTQDIMLLPNSSSITICVSGHDDNTVIALYNYAKRSDSDINFDKDDILIILDKSNNDWWKARNTRTREEGYIPSNYVAATNSLEAKE